MLNKTKFALILVIAVIGFISYLTHWTQAATLLNDDFSGTTIDTVKWNETDAGGVGGTTGNIQQNGSLSTTGSATWGQNYVVTDQTFDRSLGSLEMEADVTCGASNSIMGIGYGDPGVLTGGGDSYTMYAVSNVVYFSRQHANANAENFPTGFSCTNGVAFHVRIAIGASNGASIYINGNGTPAVTLTGGTFNNKGFFLSGHSGTATLIDNFVVSGLAGATEPDAPTGLTATPSSTQMALEWTAPASNGGSAITDYLVEYKLTSEPTTWSTFSDGTSTATNATVTGLSNGTSYDFRVSAVNAIGTGSASSTVTETPELNVPSTPLSLSASSGSSGQSNLTWSAPATDGGAAITDYIVEYKLNSEPTTWSTFSDGTSTATNATVTGLTNGSLYNFRVKAVNSVGTSAASSVANATPNSYALTDDFTGTTIDTDKWTESDAGGVGGTVGNVTQSGNLSITPTSASWASQNGVATVETYDRTNGDVSMEFSVTRSSCGTGVGPVAAGYGDMNFTVGGSASYIFLSNVSNWEIYYWLNGANQSNSPQTISGFTSCTNGVPTTFKIVAKQGGGVDVYVNGAGSPSATISGGTFTNKSFWFGGLNASGTVTYDDVYIIEPATGPEAPTGLDASAGNGQVDLTWTAGADNGSAITDYLIEYKLTSDSTWTTFSDGTSASTSATVTGLTNGRNYSFRVSGINGNGTSNPSSTDTATPISGTPTAPSASAVTITGNAAVGEQLTGSYTYIDANGNTESGSTFRWLRAASAGGSYSAIAGATSLNYTVTEDDIDMYLKFEVTPHTATSPTTGSAALSSATAQVEQVDYLNMILSTGQSLSVGVNASPALSTTQPYSNKMLTGASGGMGTGASFTPLIESGVETMSSSIANSLTYNDVGQDLDTVMGLHGVSGYTYSQLKKGTGPYANGMTQVTNAKSAATALGRVLRVLGVTSIHGETDNFNGVSGATYQGYLEEWQNDYNTDVKAITGQSNDVPLFIDQMSSFMSSYANDATSEIPIYQLYAAEDNPGDIVLVAPKYFFNYSDRHHLTAASSRWLGEYHAKVIKKVALEHESWRPLSPDSATRNGDEIFVKFHVPEGQLEFDTTLVSPRTNYGFEYYDSTSSASISSVEIVSDDTVKVTLNQTPTGGNQRIRYAYTGVPGTDTGAQNAGSAAGNLRDTDDYPSAYGNTLYNWAVHFDEAITLDETGVVIDNLDADASSTSATITWDTDEQSSTQVSYGTTSNTQSSTSVTNTSPRVTEHSVSLSNLIPCTTYLYRAVSLDASDNETASTGSFTTLCSGSAAVTAQTSGSITNASGGSVQLTSGGAGITVDVPAGAAGADADFQLKMINLVDSLDELGVPNGVASAGYVFELVALSDPTTEVTSFSDPVTLTVHYNDLDIGDVDEESLVLYHYTGGTWVSLAPCTVDATANTVTCETSSFSPFALFGTQSESSQTTSGSKIYKGAHDVGTNIVDSNGTIYTISPGNVRRPYTSAGAYLSYGFNNWGNAVQANSVDMSMPVGSFIPPRDGSIVCSDRGTDKGTCYLISNEQKAGFTSAVVFKELGFKFEDSVWGDVSFMPTADNISSSAEAHRTGVLLFNNGTLQIVGQQALIGIPSMGVLMSWGYDPLKSIIANKFDLLLQQTKVLIDRKAGELKNY